MALPPALINGSFEEPAVTSANMYEILGDSSQTSDPKHVPGWLTTATDHKVELWKSGMLGVPSDDGAQFAELNANQVSTLYQDVATVPGTLMSWRLSHRGRGGKDTMELAIGPPDNPVAQQQFTDDKTAWGHYEGTYTVPADQLTTRFAFRSVSAAGGNPSVGNFLDGIYFSVPEEPVVVPPEEKPPVVVPPEEKPPVVVPPEETAPVVPPEEKPPVVVPPEEKPVAPRPAAPVHCETICLCVGNAHSLSHGTEQIVVGFGEMLNATFEIAGLVAHYSAGSTKPGTPRPTATATATAAGPAPATPAATPPSAAETPCPDKLCAPPLTVAVHYGLQTMTNILGLLANGVRDIASGYATYRPCPHATQPPPAPATTSAPAAP